MQNNLNSALKFALFLLIAHLATSKMQGGIGSHDLSDAHHFTSVSEITNYFAKARVSIEVLPLKQFNRDHFLFAAYPYSGLDTIDVYCYAKYGEQWQIKMLYFHLRP